MIRELEKNICTGIAPELHIDTEWLCIEGG